MQEIKKQVRLNKDASEERDEDRIEERDLPDLIADCLQIVCRLFVSYLLFCKLLAIL